jgi:lipoprotein signal peptidase
MKKNTNNPKDKTKYDGPEKPDAYMGNDKQWVFRALVLAFVDMCIIAISFFFALMIRFEFSYSHIPLSFLEGYLHIVPLFMVISLVVFYIFRLYHSIWRFASINEFMHIIGAFLVLTVIMICLITYVVLKMPLIIKYIPVYITCILLAAGAIGNFIDRVRLGYVRDFIYFKIINFPVFNIADMYVVCSGILLVMLVCFRYKNDEDYDFLRIKKEINNCLSNSYTI